MMRSRTAWLPGGKFSATSAMRVIIGSSCLVTQVNDGLQRGQKTLLRKSDEEIRMSRGRFRSKAARLSVQDAVARFGVMTRDSVLHSAVLCRFLLYCLHCPTL